MEHLPILQPKSCGECTMCCKLFPVPEYDKVQGEWCRHCVPGKGCSIHDTRKDVCRNYQCIWSITPEMTEDTRPDRLKALFAGSEDGNAVTCHIDNVVMGGKAAAKIFNAIEGFRERYTVFVVWGKDIKTFPKRETLARIKDGLQSGQSIEKKQSTGT